MLEQEREAYSKMQEVNRQKTLFLGSAAHESVTSESVALSTAVFFSSPATAFAWRLFFSSSDRTGPWRVTLP
jgi:hypothetical protein